VALGGELGGIAHQVGDDLPQAQRIAAHPGRLADPVETHRQALLAHQRHHAAQRRRGFVGHVERLVGQRELAIARARQVQDLFDRALQGMSGLHRHLEVALQRRVRRVAARQVHQPEHARQGRAQLVTHVGEESCLGLFGIARGRAAPLGLGGGTRQAGGTLVDQAFQRLLRHPLVVHVAQRPGHDLRPPVSAGPAAATQQHPAPLAVGIEHTQLQQDRCTLFERRQPGVPPQRQVFRVQTGNELRQIRRKPTGRMAQDAAEAFREPGLPTGDRHLPEAVARALRGAPPARQHGRRWQP
jgi:hypothetical protein